MLLFVSLCTKLVPETYFVSERIFPSEGFWFDEYNGAYPDLNCPYIRTTLTNFSSSSRRFHAGFATLYFVLFFMTHFEMMNQSTIFGMIKAICETFCSPGWRLIWYGWTWDFGSIQFFDISLVGWFWKKNRISLL